MGNLSPAFTTCELLAGGTLAVALFASAWSVYSDEPLDDRVAFHARICPQEDDVRTACPVHPPIASDARASIDLVQATFKQRKSIQSSK